MLFVIIGLVKGEGRDVKGGGGAPPFPPLGETLHYILQYTCIYMYMNCIHTSVETIGKEHAQCTCTIDDSATVTIAVLSEWATMWFKKCRHN